ncbi:hypothetical protein ACIA5E_11735 [Nocardia asteroides]|uniref:hypothetical protein n=1 Tax=Nocardia asteroides TaxID=1824 RepID=UPI0037908148
MPNVPPLDGNFPPESTITLIYSRLVFRGLDQGIRIFIRIERALIKGVLGAARIVLFSHVALAFHRQNRRGYVNCARLPFRTSIAVIEQNYG